MTDENLRDWYMTFFLPESQPLLNGFPKTRMEEVTRSLLGTDSPGKCLRTRYEKTPAEDPEAYLEDKRRNYRQVNYRYARIFEFCRVIGVRNIYDIGCQGINQAFLLAGFTAMSYTGIDYGMFALSGFSPNAPYTDYLSWDVKDGEVYNIPRSE